MTLLDIGRQRSPSAPPPTGRRHRSPWWADQRLLLLVILAILCAVFAAISPEFLNQRLVLRPLLTDIAIYVVVGLAQMVVLSVGHMNLAVGRMAAFGAMVAGISFDLWGFPLWAGLALGIAGGAAAGAVAGAIIAGTGVNSFVVTLAIDFALLGLISIGYAALAADGAAFTSKPAGFTELRSHTFADLCAGDVCGSPAVPQLGLLTLVAVVLVGWVYQATRAGRELLLTGSNPVAAELAGVSTARRIVLAHTMSGALAGLAGFMLALTTGSFKASIGAEFLLPSFLGPLLGGTALAGGLVSVAGTVLGTALTSVVRQGLNIVGVGLDSLNVYLGVILLLAVSSDRIRSALVLRRVSRS